MIALTLALCAYNSDPRGTSRKYLRNGNEYLAKGKYKEASLLYRRALQKHAKYAEGVVSGLVNDRLEKLAEARKDFTRAMDLDPASTAAIVRLGDLDLRFYAADQSRNKELLADLEELAQTLLRRDKKSYDGLRFSGEIDVIENDLPRAIGSFRRCESSEALPEGPGSRARSVARNRRQDERAVALARDMIQHDPTLRSVNAPPSRTVCASGVVSV